MRIKGKYPQWKYWMQMTFMAPIPWEADAFYAQPGMAERGMTLDTWPVGTGPFMVTEFLKDRRIVMKRNPNYRGEPYPCEGMPGDKEKGLLDDCGKPTPFIDSIVATVEREGTPLRNKFRDGYYDLEVFERTDTGNSYRVEMNDSEDVRADYLRKGFDFPQSADVNSYIIGFNMIDPVIGMGDTPEQRERNRKLRQAISIAIDWEEYSKIFPKKAGETAMSPLPQGIPGSREGTPEGVNPVTHTLVDGKVVRRSIEEAKQLMVEAGYPNGRDAKTGRPLVINYDFYARADARAQARDRLGGAPVRQARHPARRARHRQQPVPGQGAQGQAPGLLARLERRLPGRRELHVPALRAQLEERVGRREHRELPEPRIRQALRAVEVARRRARRSRR